MRTTVTLDDDVLSFARAQAKRERISVGQALSRLARDGICGQGQLQSGTATAKPKSRFSLLAARGEVVTSARVRELMDQEGN